MSPSHTTEARRRGGVDLALVQNCSKNIFSVTKGTATHSHSTPASMSKLHYSEKVAINKQQECDQLRRSILHKLEQLPAMIQQIHDTRRLQWVDTKLGYVLKEKKLVASAERKADARRSAREYYQLNREKVQARMKQRREKIRSIGLEGSESRLKEANKNVALEYAQKE